MGSLSAGAVSLPHMISKVESRPAADLATARPGGCPARSGTGRPNRGRQSSSQISPAARGGRCPNPGSMVADAADAARRLRSRLGGATSHRSEWGATTQVHIDENHGTLRRVETNGLAAGAKSSPAMLECVHQDGKTWQLGLVPAEPAPSTRLNLSVSTRRRHRTTAKDRCFHSRTQTKRILVSCPCSRCDRIKPTQTACPPSALIGQTGWIE